MFAATPEDGQFAFEYSDSGFCNGGRHEGISKWRHGHAFPLTVQGRNLPSYLSDQHPQLLPKLAYIKVMEPCKSLYVFVPDFLVCGMSAVP